MQCPLLGEPGSAYDDSNSAQSGYTAGLALANECTTPRITDSERSVP